MKSKTVTLQLTEAELSILATFLRDSDTRYLICDWDEVDAEIILVAIDRILPIFDEAINKV